MRFIALYVLAMAVAACANNDTAWSGLDAERNACRVRALASPEFQALQYRLQSVSNSNKATPAEALNGRVSMMHSWAMSPFCPV